MIQCCVADVVDATGAEFVRGDVDAAFAGVSTDTRSLVAGVLFCAISGPNFDGNHFASDAAERGAAGILVNSQGAQDVIAKTSTSSGAGPAIFIHADPGSNYLF